jgi:hypothetical protein
LPRNNKCGTYEIPKYNNLESSNEASLSLTLKGHWMTLVSKVGSLKYIFNCNGSLIFAKRAIIEDYRGKYKNDAKLLNAVAR